MSKAASSAVFLITKNERIYLMNRHGTKNYKDYWALPGGHVEEKETSRQAAVREVKEETGLDLLSHRFQFVCLNEREDNFLCAIYAVCIGAHEHPANTEPEKHSDWQHFSFADVLELEKTIPGIRSIVAEYFIEKKVQRTW